MNQTRSPNLIDMQLDQLIDRDLPREVVEHHVAVRFVVDQIDLDIAKCEAKLRALKARKLNVKYGLVAKCMDEVPFKRAVQLYRMVCVVNPQFLNHPQVLRWMRKHKADFQSQEQPNAHTRVQSRQGLQKV